MKVKGLKCYICGGNIIYNEETHNYICNECNAAHDSEMFNLDDKKNKTKYQLTKIKILVALLATLYVLYFFYRRFS